MKKNFGGWFRLHMASQRSVCLLSLNGSKTRALLLLLSLYDNVHTHYSCFSRASRKCPFFQLQRFFSWILSAFFLPQQTVAAVLCGSAIVNLQENAMKTWCASIAGPLSVSSFIVAFHLVRRRRRAATFTGQIKSNHDVKELETLCNWPAPRSHFKRKQNKYKTSDSVFLKLFIYFPSPLACPANDTHVFAASLYH